MNYELRDFEANDIEAAIGLFRQGYLEARSRIPLLPRRALEDGEWLHHILEKALGKPGVSLLHEGRLAGFMATTGLFTFKGRKAAFVPEIAHAAEGDKERCYRAMYGRIAAAWADEGVCLHLLGFLEGDDLLRRTAFELGYGAILHERVRGLEAIPMPRIGPARIDAVEDAERLVEIEMEHNAFYVGSPVFLNKEGDRQSVGEDLARALAGGDRYFAAVEGGRILGYLSVGRSSDDGEGLLLRGTNSAQIKAAFVKPSARNRSIGRALLSRAIDWAGTEGFERIFVEHETANPLGSAFWHRHFEAYLTYAMRYVDPSALEKAN